MTSMIRNPAVKAFTYAPGKAPAGKQAQEIKLQPGQTLAFQPGVGYYAKPAGGPYGTPARPQAPAPAAPPPSPYAPLTPDQIDAQASAKAQAALTPQENEIRRQQALATANAQADETKITGLQTAAAGLMAELGPEQQAAYERAAQTEGQLGQGLATGVANDVQQRVAADTAFMQSQGQQGGTGPDTAALHDTVYDLNGRIPGDTFAEQGATAAAWGLAQAPIALNAGREELAARMAQAKTENDGYAQQLIQLAAQYPDQKAAALQQLNQYELDKANYRLSVTKTNADIASQKRQDALAARSERAQEKAAGITATINKQKLQYQYANLKFQTQKEIDKVKASGKIIDVGASKLVGHIVYKDGSQDPSIKVQQSAPSGGLTASAKIRARTSANQTAFKEATTLLGKPVAAPKGSKGAYVAKSGTNSFPPAYPGGPRTTNNPRFAAHAGGASGWQDAFSKVWAAIDGDTLVQSYGYSKEQVTAWVTAALRRSGWKRK